MKTHIIENHNQVNEELDPEIFDNDFHEDFIWFFIDE